MTDTRFYDAHGPLTLNDIINGLPTPVGGPSLLEGSAGAIEILGAQSLRKAGKNDIAYAESRAAVKMLAEAKAGACFVKAEHADIAKGAGIIPLITPLPRAAFAHSLSRLFTRIAPDFKSSLSTIDETAVLAPNVCVAQNVSIGKNVTIGPGVIIGLASLSAMTARLVPIRF